METEEKMSRLFLAASLLAAVAFRAAADTADGMPGMPAAPAPASAQSGAAAPGSWPGITSGQTMGSMGGCPMMGAGMTAQAGSAMPMGQGSGLGMNMDGGAALQSLLQTVTMQSVLESLLDLADAQGKALTGPADPDRQALMRALAARRDQIRRLIEDNRAQITGPAASR
jgi:hypothetical protein